MGKTVISFSFEPTAELVALKPENVDEDLHVQVPKNNYIARLVAKPGFEDILHFFKNHFIFPALVKTPGTIYPQLLCEFWYTCSHSIVDGVSVITGFIENGTKEITFSAATLRMVLDLPDSEAFDPFPSIDESKQGIIDLTEINVPITVGRNGSKRFGTIHKTHMDGIWNVFFGTVIQCLGTKQGSFDQINAIEAQLAWSLINNFNVDFAGVIFEEIMSRVTAPTRSEYVPYSRFLSLIIKDQFDSYDGLPFQGVNPSVVGAHIFSKPASVTLPPTMLSSSKPVSILFPTPLSSLPASSPSLITSPATVREDQPSIKIPSPTAPRKSKLGPRTLKVTGRRSKKTSKGARVEAVTERSVTEGDSDKPEALTTSLDSQKSIDFKRGQLQTATIAQTIAGSDSDVSPIQLESQTLSHLTSSQKDVISTKGQGSLVGDNTLISSDPMSTDPAQSQVLLSSSSITALAANDSLLTHSELQATTSIPNDPSVQTPTDDDEGVTPMDISVSGADLGNLEGTDDTLTSSLIKNTDQSADQSTLRDQFGTEGTSPIKELEHFSFSSDDTSVAGDDHQPDQELAIDDQVDQLLGTQSSPQPENIIGLRSVEPQTNLPASSSPLADPQTEKSPQQEAPSSTLHAGTHQVFMEYVASSRQEVRILKEARDQATEFVSDVSSKLLQIAELTNLHSERLNQHSDQIGSMASFTKEVESSVTAQNKAIDTQNKAITAQQKTIAAVTKAQAGMQATMEEYIVATSAVIDELPKIYQQGEEKIDHTIKLIFERAKEIDRMKELVLTHQGLLSEIPVLKSELTDIKALLLRTSTSKATQTSPSNSGDDSEDGSSSENDGDDHSGGSAGAGTYSGGTSGTAPMAAFSTPLNYDDKKGEKRQLADFLVLPTIFEHPEQEDQAVAADQAATEVAQDASTTSVFNEVSVEELRLYNLMIKEWAQAAVIQGELDNVDSFPTESYEQQRWDWICRPKDQDSSDQEMISSVISKKRKGKEIMDSQPMETSESPKHKKAKVTDEEIEELEKIVADLDAQEEAQTQLQLIADRELQLKLFADQAAIQDELVRKQLADDEASLKLARELIKEEHELKLKGKKPPKPTKKQVTADSDRLLNERDRKVYAQRMVGRTNPAPITKVKLKKSKSASQTQLMIYRGDQMQAITLDQIYKLHREEWNEIRLAISHSSSAAKELVMQEIDRLFNRMVRLGLLREDEVPANSEGDLTRPTSPRYSTNPRKSLYRVPNTRNLNLSLPENAQRVDGLEVLHPEVGVVYTNEEGRFEFQREAELHKADHDQLMNLLLKVACLPDNSQMRKAVMDEALARHMRYLPSEEKYEIMRLLEKVKMEEP